MDPTTTLVTFMLQTHPSVRTVRLLGSWDNFTTSYAMERDSRRDRGQWKGCYSFKDITCDDDSGVGPSRQGGLKMGNTYHYFYELDGTHETHDPARPSTRNCAYMPGQTVNTLFVPIQQTLRKRSASLSSMRTGDFMTMNPSDKYTNPRPAQRSPLSNLTTAAASAVPARLGSSPHLRHRSSARSLSPSPSWKRFFRRPHAAEQQQQRSATPELLAPSEDDDARSVRSHVSAAGSGSRSRDISPESLRRFLVDDSPPSPVGEWPSVVIPEDIAEEEEEAEVVEDVDDDEDEDDNFASVAAVELDDDAASSTGLAPPPPFRRTASSPAPAVMSWFGLPPPLPSSRAPSPLAAVDDESPVLPDFENRSRFSFSSASSCASSAGAGADDDAEAPPVYDYEERVASAGYGLPASAGSKAGGEGRLLQEELGWMVDIIKS